MTLDVISSDGMAPSPTRAGAIILPWPPKACWPNFRSRTFHAKARDVRKARDWALLATKADMPKCPLLTGRIPLLLTYHPRAQHPDKDNCLSAAKAYLDGIAEAWAVNDRCFDPRVVFGARVKGGRVVVTIG
ncbi:hypothetical protein [Rhizorhabdus wittichii]|uniref:hypothetical protein n=1 Tax=Rhizorhabdus wittichii TaxID=160791 RepID=UPI000363D8B4|nr:hypothetical protein [Rhizorhabdus wittichii]